MRNPSPLALFVVMLPSPSCFAPDVPALEEKMLEECRLAPSMPQCAHEDEALRAQFSQEYFSETIRSPAAQECFLDIDCDWMNRDVSAILQDIRACQSLAPPQVGVPFADRDCRLACDTEVFTCGGDECDAAEAQTCLAAYRACKARCRWVPFAR